MNARTLAATLLAAAVLMPTQPSAADRAGAAAAHGAPVTTGDVAPDLTLADQDGRSHTLASERGKRPVVLIFYRGHW